MSLDKGATGSAPRVLYRHLNGLILLDKPTGVSSNNALQQVRRLYRAQKAGHTGALDPLASGMLPICFGESTRLAGLLLNANKAYTTTATLGARSTTGDSEGELLEQKAVPTYSDAQIEAVLSHFRGQISQVPPMYSALKHQGQALYKLARQGQEVERKPRTITIHQLRLAGRDQSTLQLSVECSKGTYIRTLVEDIGQRLGCGAYVSALRRTWVEGFQALPMYTLDQLSQMSETALSQCLLPTEAGLGPMPRLQLDSDQSKKLCHGQALFVQAEPVPAIALFGSDDRLLAVAAIDHQGRVQTSARFGTKSRNDQ